MMAMAILTDPTLTDLRAAASAAEPTATSAKSAQRDHWKQQTVSDFFARCNWENLEVSPASLEADPAIAFDYNRSVGQFFSSIPWAGGAVVPVSPAQDAPAAAALPNVAQSGQDESLIEELPDLEDIADESHLDGGDVTLDDFLGSFSL